MLGQAATTVAAVEDAGSRLRALVTDTDELLCAVPDFTMGWWIDAARRIAANDTVQRDALEWAARSQPSAIYNLSSLFVTTLDRSC